jgi:hypothetical protein
MFLIGLAEEVSASLLKDTKSFSYLWPMDPEDKRKLSWIFVGLGVPDVALVFFTGTRLPLLFGLLTFAVITLIPTIKTIRASDNAGEWMLSWVTHHHPIWGFLEDIADHYHPMAHAMLMDYIETPKNFLPKFERRLGSYILRKEEKGGVWKEIYFCDELTSADFQYRKNSDPSSGRTSVTVEGKHIYFLITKPIPDEPFERELIFFYRLPWIPGGFYRGFREAMKQDILLKRQESKDKLPPGYQIAYDLIKKYPEEAPLYANHPLLGERVRKILAEE